MAKEDVTNKDIISELKDMQDENNQEHLEPVNLVIGRYQPFTVGHLGMAKELKKENGLPSVYVYVRSKSGKNKKFSDKLTSNYMEDVVKGEDLVKDAFSMESAFIPVIIKEAQRRGYNPVLVGAGEDRAKAYKGMVKRMTEPKTHPDFEVKELKGRLTSATEVREAILDEDEKKFKKLVPKAIQPYYTQLKDELEQSIAMSESFTIEDVVDFFGISDKLVESILLRYDVDLTADSMIVESILDYELNESKIKYQKGKTYQSGNGWTVYKNDDEVHISIDVNPGAGWQTDPHYTSEFRFMDSGKKKAIYNFKSGNIEKQAKEMYDIGTKDNNEIYGLSPKDYADILRVSMDMQNNINKLNESLNKLSEGKLISFGSNLDVSIHKALDKVNKELGTRFSKNDAKKSKGDGEIWYEFKLPKELSVDDVQNAAGDDVQVIEESLNEGVMSDINQIAKDSKDFKAFRDTIKKEYPKLKDSEIKQLYDENMEEYMNEANKFFKYQVGDKGTFLGGDYEIIGTQNFPKRYDIKELTGKLKGNKDTVNQVDFEKRFKIKESLNESKLKFKEDYPVYHDTFGSALDAITNYVESAGYKIDEQDFFAAFGDAFFKPRKGDTLRKTVDLEDKNGNKIGNLHAQIYNRGTSGNAYELNVYTDQIRKGLKESVNESDVGVSRKMFKKELSALMKHFKNDGDTKEELYRTIKEFFGQKGITVFEHSLNIHNDSIHKAHNRVFERVLMFRNKEISLSDLDSSDEKAIVPFLSKLSETKLDKFKNALNEMVSPDYQSKIDSAVVATIKTNRPTCWEDFKSSMTRSEFFKKDFRPFLMMQGLSDYQIDRYVENLLLVKYQHYTNYYLGNPGLQYTFG